MGAAISTLGLGVPWSSTVRRKGPALVLMLVDSRKTSIKILKTLVKIRLTKKIVLASELELDSPLDPVERTLGSKLRLTRALGG